MESRVPVVTSLSPSRRSDGRVDILVDGELLGTLTIEAVSRLGLTSGMTLDSRLAAAIRWEARALATYDRAVKMLAVRARSTRDLRLALLRKGEPDEHVHAAIERLRAVGHLNDDAFARQFARSCVLGSGFSRRRVQGELIRRGIAMSEADAAIDDVMLEESVDEEEMLMAAARRRLRALSSVDERTRHRRLFAYLARRGFEPGDIARVLGRLLKRTGELDEAAGQGREAHS